MIDPAKQAQINAANAAISALNGKKHKYILVRTRLIDWKLGYTNKYSTWKTKQATLKSATLGTHPQKTNMFEGNIAENVDTQLPSSIEKMQNTKTKWSTLRKQVTQQINKLNTKIAEMDTAISNSQASLERLKKEE